MKKFDRLIFTLDNCMKYFTSTDKIRTNMYKLYKGNEHIGTFANYKDLSLFIGVAESTVLNYITGKYAGATFNDYKIEKVDTSPYQKVKRSDKKILVAKNGKDIKSFESITEAAKYFKIPRHIMSNVVKGLVDNKNGYTFYWED